MSADRDRTAAGRDAPSDELVGIVIDAGRRGFSRRRVAVALGISGPALARIEQIDAREDIPPHASGTPRRAGGG